MKPSTRSAVPVLARLQHFLQALPRALKGWLPGPAPALVPIPIQAGRRPRVPAARHPDRGG